MIETNENLLRLTVFLGMLIIMLVLESLFPRRARSQQRRLRWGTNIGLIVLSSVALKLSLPLVAVGSALLAEQHSWGLFNSVQLPIWLEFIAAMILLDLAIYAQHVATHRIPVLWRLHKVHHADRDIDVTTGIRFHPIEIVISMLYKIVCVMALGPAVAAVICFEVLLNACALFNHANLKLNKDVDKVLRWLIVTPDMHRVHHSVVQQETNSNYGFSLSLWDRVFSTYIDQPTKGHKEMTIGLSEHQDDQPNHLTWTLLAPFKSLTHKS